MKKLILLIGIASIMVSCAQTVEIVVKNEAGSPYIGAHVYVLTEDIPEIKKQVIFDNQCREQDIFKVRLALVGLSAEEAEAKAKEQYDQYHKERPDMSPYGYVTHEMRMENVEAFTTKITDLLIDDDNITGTTNAVGTFEVKLKEGDYYIYIEDGLNALKYYGPLSVYEEKTKVYTLK